MPLGSALAFGNQRFQPETEGRGRTKRPGSDGVDEVSLLPWRLATSVFRDPLALTIYDDEHSEAEERRATLGQADNGQYVVVIHTWKHPSLTEIVVRIVSARRATKEEMRNYQEQPRLRPKVR